MAGHPQRVALALSIQCWHSGTMAVAIFSPSRGLRGDCGIGCGCCEFTLNPRVGPLPPFCKIFRIRDFAVFSWQIPVSKEVISLVLSNHRLTSRDFARQALGPGALCSLC